MRKYRGILVLFIILAMTNLFLILLLGIGLLPLSGHDISTTAAVGIFIINNRTDLGIHIDSPVNGTTYNFNIGSNRTLDLNVSSDSEVDFWSYDLFDIKHGVMIYNDVNFTPNSTIDALRWGNKLTVYGSNGIVKDSRDVYFEINVPNSPPVMDNISNPILACEGGFLSYSFNVSDVDENDLTLTLSPTNPFYVFPDRFFGESNVTSNIVSSTLRKSSVGIHLENVSVSDGQYSDSKHANITVIEINNAPLIDYPGVRTIWNNGPDSTLNEQINVSDIENGNQFNGNLTFNLTFYNGIEPFFNINNSGYITYTANRSYLGVYNLSACVTDKGITNIHPNISICGQNGSPIQTCQDFSLTITDNNRAPNITSHNPENLTVNMTGYQSYSFNITTYDPDGTIPDSYWYYDDGLLGFGPGNVSNNYTYTVPCGLSGQHNFSVMISDGLLNQSLTWNLSISGVNCPVPTPGGGGKSGGGVGISCNPAVVCNPWDVCTNLEGVFKKNSISNNDYIGFKNACLATGFNDDSCGYQIRSCIDLHACNYTFVNESEAQYCEYVKNPSCNDGIKNCHDGDCEVLVDCGGPCQECATCSDGIKNQGEQGIDCGGPCPTQCPSNLPILKKEELKNVAYIIISIILIILIIAIILRIIKIAKIKKEMGELKWYALFKRTPEQQ